MKQTTLIIKVVILLIVFILPCISVAAEKPEIFVQLGHWGQSFSISLSPDGRFAMSGGQDKTVRLWDVATGREVRVFQGHLDNVVSVSFSPDGRFALSADWSGVVKLWELSTGQEIRTFKGNQYSRSVSFSSDRRRVLLAGLNSVEIWETFTGQKLQTFDVKTSTFGSPVILDGSGHYLLYGDDQVINLFDLSTGVLKQTFEGHTGYVSSLALSPNGKHILSGGSDNTVRLWDAQTGSVIKVFKGHTDKIIGVSFSPDGQFALSGDSDVINLWDISTGVKLRTFQKHYAYDRRTMAFSPDGKLLLSSGSNEISLFEVATGKVLRNFKGNVAYRNSFAVSYDGQHALSSTSRDNSIRLWDLSTGTVARVFQRDGDSKITSLAFSRDGKYVLSGGYDKTIRLWNAETGNRIQEFLIHSSGIAALTFSPDGQFAVSGDTEGNVKFWEISTGKEVWTYRKYFNPEWYKEMSFAFSNDGKNLILTLGSNGRASATKILEAGTGREIISLSEFNPSMHGSQIYSVGFSKDGHFVVTGGYKGVSLWDIATGNKLRTFGSQNLHSTSVSFSTDGRQVLSGCADNTVRLWDTSTGQEVRTLFNPSWVKEVGFSPDGRRIWASSESAVMNVWNATTGVHIYTMAEFYDGEWIVITPEGYYNSSANGDKHLNVRIGNNVYGIDQYRSAFYKPQIVEAALKLGDTQKAVAEVIGETKTLMPTIATIQNIEPPFIVIKSPEDGKKISSISADLSLYIEDRNQTIKSVKILVNGRQITASDARGATIKAKDIELLASGTKIPEGRKTLDVKVPVKLENGENLIEVKAFNGFSEGRKSIRIYSEEKVIAKKGEVILPNLWILSIGINKYQDKRLTSLSYAVADAEGIVNAFKGQKGKLFREINSLIINDNSSIKPTRDNITDNLDYVKKAGHNDVVLLFIAGHGINDDSGEFYFLPSDAVISEDGSIKKSKAISWRDIKAILDIPAKKLIFADTCHSEGVSGKKTRGVDNDRFVKELQEANAVIFTSSRGRELSQESDKWEHGAFTYALIEGVKGKADLIKDGKISMKELDAYVSETVPKITNGAQHPITNTPEGYVNFPVALVE